MRYPRGANVQNARSCRNVAAIELRECRNGWFINVIDQFRDGIKPFVIVGISADKIFKGKGCFRGPLSDESNRLDGELVRGRIASESTDENSSGAWVAIYVSNA